MPSITTDGIMNGALAAFLAAINRYLPLLIFWGGQLLSAVVYVGFGYMPIQAVSNRDWMRTLIGLRLGDCSHRARLRVFGEPAGLGWRLSKRISNYRRYYYGPVANVLTPSGMYDLGLHIVAVMRNNFHWAGWLHPFKDIDFHFLIPFVQLTWFAIACVYLAVLLESNWIVAKGAVTIIYASFDYGWGCLATGS